MKRSLGLFVTLLFFASPMLFGQEQTMNHIDFGVFANYYRFTNPGPTSNFLGLGGRAAFGVRPNVQLEAEMAYDFERNYTSTSSNGISTTAVNSKLRTLHGFFGPKFDIGTPAIHLFVTGKVGFDNFNVTNNGAPTGFVNSVGLGNGATYFAVYPAAGLEGFFGPIGLRVEAGDDVFFHGGAQNNLRVTFGPQFRF
ncbi:MAG TPA: hypothetical protein VJQ59_14865 [Candidatus Sulfotelmatobacter sp.]|nr:hypothetical protein [Candidatus Sulfotelmatobacter sp.]